MKKTIIGIIIIIIIAAALYYFSPKQRLKRKIKNAVPNNTNYSELNSNVKIIYGSNYSLYVNKNTGRYAIGTREDVLANS